MSPLAVFCMDAVTLLQGAAIPATQQIFEQNYVSRICFASCQTFFLSRNGAFALGKGAGEGSAAADLPGLGDGDDTRQPVVSRLPAQIHLQLAAKKSLPLVLVHGARGDKSVGLGAWQMQSRDSSSRGGLGQENFKIILMMPLIVATGGEAAERVVSVAGPGRAPGSAAEAVGSTQTQFFMRSAWQSELEGSLCAGY